MNATEAAILEWAADAVNGSLTYHCRAHCGLLAQLHIGYRSSLFADSFRFDSHIRPQILLIDGQSQRRTSPARRCEKHSVWWFSANWHSPQNGLVRPPHSITWSHSLRVAWELVVGYIINRVPLWRIMSLSNHPHYHFWRGKPLSHVVWSERILDYKRLTNF